MTGTKSPKSEFHFFLNLDDKPFELESRARRGTALSSDAFTAGAAGPTPGTLTKNAESLFESVAYASGCGNYDAYTINEQKVISILPACGSGNGKGP